MSSPSTAEFLGTFRKELTDYGIQDPLLDDLVRLAASNLLDSDGLVVKTHE